MSQQNVRAPATYDFEGWDSFYWAALRYHNTMCPEKKLVVDRIRTFRQFMSAQAREHLGAYVRCHPRYETTRGWDQWARDVRTSLYVLDPIIAKVDANTTENWIKRYQRGMCTVEALWTALDKFAESGRLSSRAQRERFWGALKQDTRKDLAEACPFFDPSNRVWTEQELEDDATVATQELARVMELRLSARRAAWKRAQIKLCTALFVLSLAYLVYFVRWFYDIVVSCPEEPEFKTWLFFLTILPIVSLITMGATGIYLADTVVLQYINSLEFLQYH